MWYIIIFLILPLMLIVAGPGLIGRLVGLLLMGFVVYVTWGLGDSSLTVTAETVGPMTLADVEIEEYDYDYGDRLLSLVVRNRGPHALAEVTLLAETFECDTSGCLRIDSSEYLFKPRSRIETGQVGRVRALGLSFKPGGRPLNGGVLRQEVAVASLRVYPAIK